MSVVYSKNVFDYLNMNAEQKTEFFLSTVSKLKHLPGYWFNFSNVEKNMEKYGPDIYMYDSIINTNLESLRRLLIEYPGLIKYVPQLLGIRNNAYTKDPTVEGYFLPIQNINGEILLNFGVIDMEKFDDYFQFICDSGLGDALVNGLSKSVHDYAYGVEAGLDSNGRKNRSGKSGEEFLEVVLKNLSEKLDLEWTNQVSSNYIKEHYGIQLGDEFKNRRFDGSLYNPRIKKLYLIEVNNFNSNGSKSKASATEFINLSNRFSKTNNEFIYITDGEGWKSDRSHLVEAMEHIGKVFNYKMIEENYLYDFLNI